LEENVKILVTTSRRPNRRIRSFVKDLVSVIPGSIRITRGHLSMKDLALDAANLGASRVIIVADRRGNPGIIRSYSVVKEGEGFKLENIVSFIVKGVTLSRDRKIKTPGNIAQRADYLLVDPKLLGPDTYDFADAIALAFNGRLTPHNYKGTPVVVRPIPLDAGTVKVDFYFENMIVGPRIVLARPKQMIKKTGGAL